MIWRTGAEDWRGGLARRTGLEDWREFYRVAPPEEGPQEGDIFIQAESDPWAEIIESANQQEAQVQASGLVRG